MCVSTGIAGIPSEKHRMIAAVLGPTPGRFFSQDFASSSGISPRKDRSKEPTSSRTMFMTSLMRADFCFDSPPDLIAASMSSTGASAMASRVRKVRIRLPKARSELMSDVC